MSLISSIYGLVFISEEEKNSLYISLAGGWVGWSHVGLMWDLMVEEWVAAILSLCFASVLPTFAILRRAVVVDKLVKGNPLSSLLPSVVFCM